MIDHTTLRELAAGAALDDLEPAERAVLDRHLVTCRSCRRLASDLDDVVGELGLVAPPHRPPDGLLADVMAAVRVSDRPGRDIDRQEPRPLDR